MKICVIATASALRGALMIYKQFLNELEHNIGDDRWYVFVDHNMPMPYFPNVEYHICHTKGIGRVLFDLYGFRRICKKIDVKPDVIFSLQNTGVNYKCERIVIYYHQPLPLYRAMLGYGRKYARERVFSYLYPIYVKWFLKGNTYVAVQTNTVKELFSRRHGFPLDRIGVFFPKIEEIKINEVSEYEYEKGTINFVYPAMGSPYKEHKTLAYSMKRLYAANPSLAHTIRIHLTLEAGDINDVYQYICNNNMIRNFVFHGNLPHNKVLSMLKSSNGLLFPSVIETLGLPLLEAASFGIPIIANEMGYVHDVVGGYEGVHYVGVHDYSGWTRSMIACCDTPHKIFSIIIPQGNSWNFLFDLIRQGRL